VAHRDGALTKFRRRICMACGGGGAPTKPNVVIVWPVVAAAWPVATKREIGLTFSHN
jgi:hypothetical protein